MQEQPPLREKHFTPEAETTRLARMRKVQQNLSAIPAGEQWIGHMQDAMDEFMSLTIAELHVLRLRK